MRPERESDLVSKIDAAVAAAAARGEHLGLRDACRLFDTSTGTYYRHKRKRGGAERTAVRGDEPTPHPNAGQPRERADATEPGWGLVSPYQAQRLLSSLRLPISWATAAARAGIPANTFADWRRKGRLALRKGEAASPYARILRECEAARADGQVELLEAMLIEARAGNVAAGGVLAKTWATVIETDTDVDEADDPAAKWLGAVDKQIAGDGDQPAAPSAA